MIKVFKNGYRKNEEKWTLRKTWNQKEMVDLVIEGKKWKKKSFSEKISMHLNSFYHMDLLCNSFFLLLKFKEWKLKI